MEINYIAVLGFIAGTLTTASFLPQVLKTIKTKETKDLSLAMYVVLATGIFLWTVYGILIGSFPVIIANALSFVLASCILIFKIKYG